MIRGIPVDQGSSMEENLFHPSVYDPRVVSPTLTGGR